MALDRNANLLKFLESMKYYGLLSADAKSGIVVYADDQFVNQQAMKMNFQDIGLQDKLVLFSDGKEVVQYFDKILTTELAKTNSHLPTQPVALLLLDINMPMLDGKETMKLIKQKFEEANNLYQTTKFSHD